MNKVDPEYLQFLIDQPVYVISEKETREVEQQQTEEPAKPGEPEIPDYLAIVIALPDPYRQLDPSEQTLLKKIMEAVGYSLDLVSLIETEAALQLLPKLEKTPVKIMISFGVDVPGIPENKYQIQNQAGKKLLLADDLASIGRDKALKASLWNSLKNLFNR